MYAVLSNTVLMHTKLYSQFIIIKILSQLFCDAAQIAQADLARPIIVKERKRSSNLVHWVARGYAFCH